MSHWNHRVIKRVFDKGTPHEETLYSIHEVYYNDKGEVDGFTKDPVGVVGYDNIDGLKWVLKKMGECLEHPILNYDDII